MYAQLKDIKFQKLLGFSQLNDTQETMYARHQLIESKARLQYTGEELQEFDMTIQFHVAFCNPEVEFDKLNTYRINKEVCPLIYGNGFYENDFVITKIERTVNQTDDSGNYVCIEVNVTLLEYFDNNTNVTKQQRAQLNAFAVDVDRPLPTAPPRLDNSLAAKLYGYQKTLTAETNKINAKINATQQQILQYANVVNAAEAMGQQVVNVGNNLFTTINQSAGNISGAVTQMTTLLSGSTALFNINPSLSNILAGNPIAGVTSALAPLQNMAPVTTNSQGQFAIDQFTNLQTQNTSLQNYLQLILEGFAPFALFIALRQGRI